MATSHKEVSKAAMATEVNMRSIDSNRISAGSYDYSQNGTAGSRGQAQNNAPVQQRQGGYQSQY